MPVIESDVVVAANALSANVLAGDVHQILQSAARVDFYATGSAAGLRYTAGGGGDIIADDAVLNAQNRQPVEPDDFLVGDSFTPATPLTLRFRNTTVGALTARFRARITY